MGIPYRRLIVASNKNNVLTDFLNTGVYDLRSRSLHLTSSPAIDILKSSNLERLLYHVINKDAPHIIKECFEKLETEKYFIVPPHVCILYSYSYSIFALNSIIALRFQPIRSRHGRLLF